MGRRRGRWVSVAAAVLAAGASASAGDVPVWEALGLASAEVGGRRVYYERSLGEDVVGPLTAAYGRVMAAAGERGALAGRAGEAVAEIERLVGRPEDPNWSRGREGVIRAGGALVEPLLAVPLCVVSKAALVDYLRGGGKVAGYRLEEPEGRVTFAYGRGTRGGATTTTTTGPAPGSGATGRPDALVLLVRPGHEGEDVRKGLGILGQLDARRTFWAMLHEAAELAILQRLKPNAFSWRFFSDGMANAIADEVGARVLGPGSWGSAEAHDPAAYADLRAELNLPYWMGVAAEVDVPSAEEGRLRMARYAYATVEARALLERCGWDRLPAILDAAAGMPVRDADGIIRAVERVTGERWAGRLARYQGFVGSAAGAKLYADRLRGAIGRGDHAAALRAALRLREVDPANAVAHARLPELMVRCGHAGALRGALAKEEALLRSPAYAPLLKSVRRHFVAAAVEGGRTAAFVDVAEALLREEPDFVAGLAVRMVRMRDGGEAEGARALAGRIVGMAREDSAAYRLAHEVMAGVGR
jgi:hypothetical protein